ncbi:uncharacterized protein [Branchiostoma lanceolatum]|uniref:uncharacterized protein n=1 Tax=Branchiostoma lanceolatum TaxID=7740 RepID=UPI0034571D49
MYNMALGDSGNHTVTKTVAVFLSLTVILGRVSAMNNPTLQTERSADNVAKITVGNETLPPTNIRVDSRNLNNVVCWDAGGDTPDNNVTFEAQYIDDMEYKKSLNTWKYISDCEGVSGPCCAFFDDISVKDLETGKPICPRANGWWVRARAVGILGPSRWTTTSEWFSPFKHTVIGPPDVNVIAEPANEETSFGQQLRELNIRIKHPLTPYYMYNEHNQETMATMEDFEGFFVFYNVSYWMNGHREKSRDFVVGNDGWLKEEYSITGLRPGVVYCVEVTGFVHSLWAVRKGLPRKVCRRTADGKPSTGPFNVTWRPLPATNCSAATRSFRAIRVRWSPPPANDANGVITTYKVTITHNTENGELATIRDCVDSHIQLSGLTTFHAYTVQPSACTSAGCTKGEKLRIPSHVINAVTPTSLTKAEVTSEKITVTWFPPGNEYDCVDVYKVRYVRLSGGTLRQVIVANTTAVLTKLHPGTSYNVSVSVLYKRINHSSKSSPVESPPTPWITVSTGPYITDYKLIALFVVLGVCLVSILSVTLYFLTTRHLGKTSEESHYDFLDADILDDIRKYPDMLPITSRPLKEQRERVDSWTKEMRALANFESLIRIHADLWIDPNMESLGRNESFGSDPDSVATSSTTLANADSIEDNSTNDYFPRVTRATPSDYLPTLNRAVFSHEQNVTPENRGEAVNVTMEGDYVQHVSAATPSGCDTEIQSIASAMVTKHLNGTDYVTEAEGQIAPVKDNAPTGYVSDATPSGSHIDIQSNETDPNHSNDSGYVTSEGQRSQVENFVPSDYTLIEHRSVATPSGCNVSMHLDTVVVKHSSNTGYVASENQTEPVEGNISSVYMYAHIENVLRDNEQHVLVTTPSGCHIDMQSNETDPKHANDSGYVISEGQKHPVEGNISSDYARIQHRSIATPSGCNTETESNEAATHHSNDSGCITSEDQSAQDLDNASSGSGYVRHSLVATPSDCKTEMQPATMAPSLPT